MGSFLYLVGRRWALHSQNPSHLHSRPRRPHSLGKEESPHRPSTNNLTDPSPPRSQRDFCTSITSRTWVNFWIPYRENSSSLPLWWLDYIYIYRGQPYRQSRPRGLLGRQRRGPLRAARRGIGIPQDRKHFRSGGYQGLCDLWREPIGIWSECHPLCGWGEWCSEQLLAGGGVNPFFPPPITSEQNIPW